MSQTHYYRGDKFGNPNGTCEQVDAEFVFDLAIEQAQVEAYLEAQNAAVDAYIAAVSGTSSGGIGQTYGEMCANLVLVDGCIGTAGDRIVGSAGGGIGFPGVNVIGGSTGGSTVHEQLTGWATCIDAQLLVGGANCWNTPGPNSYKFGEVSPFPGAGIFVNYGWTPGASN